MFYVCGPADDERVLVEMACGAALAAVYSGLIGRLQDDGESAIYLFLCKSSGSSESSWQVSVHRK